MKEATENMKMALAKIKVRERDNLQNSLKWKDERGYNARNCHFQCTLTINMDWTSHMHGLDGTCYACRILCKRMRS